MKQAVEVYDTTLRDGTQGENVSFSVEDKLKITQMLDELGVTYIEGGWPGSNPKDAAYFQQVRDLSLRQARVAAFGMTCRVNGNPADDSNIQALLDAGTPVVTVVGKTSLLHVRDVIRATPEENLRIIRESLAHPKAQGREVIYDAEHFFDGYKLDPEYALRVLEAAATEGAEVLVLCDTNGGSLPHEVQRITGEVVSYFETTKVGIHTQNDSGCAVANSLAAVLGGATQVQGTVNGYGERTGNANLMTVIPDLTLKMGVATLPEGRMERLTSVSRHVAELVNLPPHPADPYVGSSAFAHKGGLHTSALDRAGSATYEHVDPATVGNHTRVLVSDLGGRAGMAMKAAELGIELDDRAAAELSARLKQLEAEGFVFEAADASLELLMREAAGEEHDLFSVESYRVSSYHREGAAADVGGGVHLSTEATVKLWVGGERIAAVGEGNGPVNALDAALRNALTAHLPAISKIHLTDFKVRVLDSSGDTGAVTRVLIDSTDGDETWTTIGVSTNVIEASWMALVDSLVYGLLRHR
mgnify:CR=1 FL=1